MTDEINELAADKPPVEYKELPTAEDLSERPKEKEYEGDQTGIEKAAKDLTTAREERRQAEAEPIERGYRWNGGLGDPVPENFTLEARRAADDLTRVRQQEALAKEPDTAAAIDEVRNAWNNPQAQRQPEVQTQTAEQPVQQPQPQPQSEPAPDGIDPEIAEALSRPKVRAALEETVAQVEQARAAYSQGLHQLATVSAAGLLASFPELVNIPTAHLQTAITAIAASNPERGAAIDQHLGRTQAIFNQFKQAEAAQQQIQAQRTLQWAAAEDARFERDVVAKEDPATMQKVKDNFVQIAQETYGISKEQLSHALQTNPILRSSAFQSVFLDAAKFRLAQRRIRRQAGP